MNDNQQNFFWTVGVGWSMVCFLLIALALIYIPFVRYLLALFFLIIAIDIIYPMAGSDHWDEESDV